MRPTLGRDVFGSTYLFEAVLTIKSKVRLHDVLRTGAETNTSHYKRRSKSGSTEIVVT